MRVLVCGGRNYQNRGRIWDALDEIRGMRDVDSVIHGGCTGADYHADRWAREKEIVSICVPARWKRDGTPQAGPIRNRRMLDDWAPDLVVAFPGHGGTANMCAQAKERGVPVRAIGW